MATAKLTQGKVSGFTCPPDKAAVILWDSITQGFGLKVSNGGRKAYVFQGRLGRNSIRVTIGSVDTWPLESVTDKAGNEITKGARQEARRLQTLLDNGIDPREEKRERIATNEAKRAEARSRDVIVSDAWAAYIADRRHNWGERHLNEHLKLAREGGTERKRGKGKTIAYPLAALMPLKLSDLSPETVKAWLKKEKASRPTQAALAFRLLRAFLRWCAETDEYKAVSNLDAVGRRINKDHVPKVSAKEADSLQREQLEAWFKAVRELGNPVNAAYLQTLLLTGARREELSALKWEDVDFQWKSLSIADKVEEGGRIIPLTPYVASLLAALPRRKDKKGKPLPWVFSSPTAALGRIKDPRSAHTRALATAALPHVSIHGLRRSFGTISEWVEAPVGVVAQIMGHKPSAIAEKHYRRRPLDLLRMWHTRIEAWMLEQAGIEQPKEVQAGLRVVK